MAAANKKPDHWSSEAYQHSASFVPKLATKVLQWLAPDKDDAILDIGCGDGVLDLELGKLVNQGKGSVHGVDSSSSMIQAAQRSVREAGLERCTFEVHDATDLVERAELQQGKFTKVFSNAAMHWILRPEEKREQFFRGARDALTPGGVFVFEMGGLGNVCEMAASIFGAVGRRIGFDKVQAINPWFFPDEAWMKHMMEEVVGGWKIEQIEREWRPTTADAGGVEGWVRLMAKQFIDAVPEEEREALVKEIVEPLEIVCRKPDGGYMFSYVRLRVKARKI